LRAALHDEAGGLATLLDAQRDAARRGRRLARDGVEGEQHPVGLERVVRPHREEEVTAPADQLADGGPERQAHRRELVDRRVEGGGQGGASHHAILDQAVEAAGQHGRAHAAQALDQVAEALGPEQQLAHDQERPALADDLGGAGEGAELRVAGLRQLRCARAINGPTTTN
jgi:hypothetical protein